MKITTAELWDEVKAVAAETPDYIYDSEVCWYARNGAPSCIVGQAMHRLGIPVDMLATFDLHGPIAPVVGHFTELFDVLDDGTLDALKVTQAWQDNHRMWGEAVAEGEKEFAK